MKEETAIVRRCLTWVSSIYSVVSPACPRSFAWRMATSSVTSVLLQWIRYSSPGATIAIQVTRAGCDKVVSTGTLDLSAAPVLNLIIPETLPLEQSYTIASATTVTGTFSGLPNGTMIRRGMNRLRIQYTATEITLGTERNDTLFLFR